MSNGIKSTGTILDRILEHKRGEIEVAEKRVPFNHLRSTYNAVSPARNFIGAIQKSDNVALIAEVKHASPSKGVLIDPFDPIALAAFYASHGAAAISILTDEKFFQGHLDYLRSIRSVVGLPLLRKEFIISPYQVYESRTAGADAVLLIAAALENELLRDLHDLITGLGMAALVEVHNEAEMERALRLNPRIVGVNNRNLHDFSVDLAITRRLAAMVPEDVVLVGESGIRTAADVQALGAVDAILVGETLVTADDRAAAMDALIHVPKQERES